MFFAANGARFGFNATIPALAGYHIATWVLTLAIGLGFIWFANELPKFLNIIKYLGSAYVFYLAWALFSAGIMKEKTQARHVGFVDGIFLLLLNPKAYLIITLVFTQLTKPSENSQVAMIIIITTIFTINNLIAFLLWTYVGDRLAAIFRQDKKARQLNILFGIMLAAVAIWMLFN
ncbi:MAG: LysE family transporter [Devosiaceae bacterium]|nr:LysE family transporter [Devosiaceae bacterium]